MCLIKMSPAKYVFFKVIMSDGTWKIADYLPKSWLVLIVSSIITSYLDALALELKTATKFSHWKKKEKKLAFWRI